MRAWRPSVAMLVVAALVLPACASSHGTTARAVADAPAASPAECASADGEALRAGLVGAATLGTWLMLRAAAEGAWYGAVVGGGRAKDATWIGAAAGLGVGALIGFAVGATKGAREYQRRDLCLVAARTPAAPEALGLAELETLLPDD